MRELTGRDELAFLERRGPVSKLVALATQLGVGSEAELHALPLPDFEERLLDLRAELLGPRVEAQLSCPACGAAALLIFSIVDLPRETPAPGTGPGPALRHLTVGDLADLEAAGATGDAALGFLLARAAGIAVPEAQALIASAEGPALIAALETPSAGLAIELSTQCTDCAAAIAAPLDVAAYLEGELEGRATRLLDEIHLIARNYHWPESTILDLPFGRRQDYIRRILADRAVPDRLGAVA